MNRYKIVVTETDRATDKTIVLSENSNMYFIPSRRLHGNKLFDTPNYGKDYRGLISQHMHIVDTESCVKNDEWFIHPDGYLLKANINSDHNAYNCNRIIASTDELLNLPSIPNDLIEDYVFEQFEYVDTNKYLILESKVREPKQFYNGFMLFFEGSPYAVDPIVDINTYAMGVTKLAYNEEENILNVHLRRPGLLIGKGGRTIDKLKEFLDCKIQIHEVKNLWD